MGVLYFLFMTFLGMMIVGFAMGNTTVGVVGLVLSIIAAVIGIIAHYYKLQDKNTNTYDNTTKNIIPTNSTKEEDYDFGDVLDKAYNSAMDMDIKVKKLRYDHNVKECFTKSELVVGIVNLREAQTVLSFKENFYVNAVYEKYQQDTKPMYLNYEEYLNITDEMIAHFDLVAPWYKYCGDSGMRLTGELATLVDKAKSSFRKRAWALIDEKKIFRDEWVILQKEFRNEFYSEWSI